MTTAKPFLVIVTLALAAEVPRSAAPADCNASPVHGPVAAVAGLMSSEEGVAVYFQGLSARYRVAADHACFRTWHRRLAASLEENAPVRFDYQADDLRIIALGAPPPQLVIGDREPADCHPAPRTWIPGAPFDRVTVAQAKVDLDAYFEGRSVQFTSLLEAATHHSVRFCRGRDAEEFLAALAEIVVRPPRIVPGHEATLPDGAELLLGAFAGPELLAALAGIEPVDDQEAQRWDQATALASAVVGDGGSQSPP